MWSYIIFLPAAVSLLWAMATLLLKHRPTNAQVLFSIMLVMLAVAIMTLAVYFRGHSGVLFLYVYIFQVLSITSVALVYIAICALTEPRGVSVRQRAVMAVPIFYVVGLTSCALIMGWRRYDVLCHNIAAGDTAFMPSDFVYNFMLVWSHIVFPLLILVFGAVVLAVGSRKVWVYQVRFNSYYAENLHRRPIDSRMLVVLSWLFLPLGVLTFWAVDFRPGYYKYWLIVLSLAMTVMQWLFGRFVYRLDHDAAFLAEYIKSKN